MIVRDHLPLRRVWPHVSKRLGGLLIFDTAVAMLYSLAGLTFLGMPSLPLGIMAAALSLFLAFRTNSAYDRWWEARKLWGALVNESRTFARQALTLVDRPSADGVTLVEWQIAYVHALRCHLRRQNPFPELGSRLPATLITWLRTQRNVPLALLVHAGERLRGLFDEGRLDSYRFVHLDATLTRLCDVQGACERIKNTPLPKQYEYFPRVLVTVYCLLLPFGLVEGMGLLTPIASSVISFIFLTLESIGRDIEAPFDNTVHDTPMSQLSRSIEINLRELAGTMPTPREVKAIDGYVY